MAFTPTERANILFYLGFSGFEDDGDAMRAINSLDNHETTMGPIVRDLLSKLAQVDQDIHDTRPLASAIEDGSVKIRAHYTLQHLQKLGRQYVARLSRWTKVPIGGDIFSASADLAGSTDPSEGRSVSSVGV